MLWAASNSEAPMVGDFGNIFRFFRRFVVRTPPSRLAGMASHPSRESRPAIPQMNTSQPSGPRNRSAPGKGYCQAVTVVSMKPSLMLIAAILPVLTMAAVSPGAQTQAIKPGSVEGLSQTAEGKAAEESGCHAVGQIRRDSGRGGSFSIKLLPVVILSLRNTMDSSQSPRRVSLGCGYAETGDRRLTPCTSVRNS
jgi:hypothetical protein